MRIKRFQAPDMRTALRMIRDEQGPDAVILSNRATDEGIEVVSATDYDEALVAQALRAAAPGLEPAPMRAATSEIAMPQAKPELRTAAPAAAPVAAPAMIQSAVSNAIAPAADAAAKTATAASARAAAVADAAPRESLMARARAMFRSEQARAEGPTLAELAAAFPGPPAAAARASTQSASPAHADNSIAAHVPAPPTAEQMPASSGRFEAMMAALAQPAPAAAAPAVDAPQHVTDDADASAPAQTAPAEAETVATATSADELPTPAPRLHAVPDAPAPDPAIAAMREEMARMRQLMEAQLAQLSLERLRGSPARAAAFDALVGFGCHQALAQTVAARIDPRLPPEDIREPMLAELARMLTVARSEPIDDGGVIALVGPTGAGKTTTAAKLAARFAARYRARDVALVTTDVSRAGAREQLHAHGLRLGVTVREAAGEEGLRDALAQLTDYPLVLVDTTGHAAGDRALLRQNLWLRAARVRSLLVLPANAHPHDLSEVIGRYRNAELAGAVLTKIDETGCLGSALSVAVRHGLNLAYTTQGQQVPADIEAADAASLVRVLGAARPAPDHSCLLKDRHAAV